MSSKATRRDTVELPPRRPAGGRRFVLKVASGPDAGRVHACAGRTVIGSDPAADLVLSDPSVSRVHCEICVEGHEVVLRDLGSLNGTHVASVRVVGAHLESGDVLLVGRTRIRFEMGAEPVLLPLSSKERFGLVLGRSIAMRRVFGVLERAVRTDATVLLEGETGTGKEVVAQSIHEESARADGPFVVVDCSAIPRELLESELFGHARGAFTGAVGSRVGAFEAAAGGTLFLDEIGELGLDLQPKLLRALEARRIKRVGSNDYVPVDVRVITATNRDLRAEVDRGAFRADLYYRLAVVEVRLPPLRERVEDLPSLVEHFAERIGATPPELAMLGSRELLREIAGHTWPGNVRELRNYVERCLALQMAIPIARASLPADAALIDVELGYKWARDRWHQHCERRYLEEQLRRSDGNVSAAARAARIDRIYFYRLLRRHGLR